MSSDPIAQSGKAGRKKTVSRISVAQGAATILLLTLNPDERFTGSVAATREQNAQGAGLHQTTNATAIAGLAMGRLGWSQGLDVDNPR
jgi:hypothetical protein